MSAGPYARIDGRLPPDMALSGKKPMNLRHERTILVISLISVAMANWPAGVWAQPASLVSRDTTLYRVNAAGTGGVETFSNQPGAIIGMTIVPAGVSGVGFGEGNVLAVESGTEGRFWRVDSARAGTPLLVEVGRLPREVDVTSIAFAHGQLFAIDSPGAVFRELSITTFEQIGDSIELRPTADSSGGLAFDGADTWYITNAEVNRLIRVDDPPTPESWMGIGENVGVGFANSGLEMHAGQLWGGLRSADRIVIGTLNVQTGQFSQVWNVAAAPQPSSLGYVAFSQACLDIATQPMSRASCTSDTAFFAVRAAGTGPFTYQWEIESAPGVWLALTYEPVFLPCGGSAFATRPTSDHTRIGVNPCPGVASYKVRCRVSSDCGSTASNAAVLSVIALAECGACCAPDIDGAGPAEATCSTDPGAAKCALRTACDVTELLPPTFAGCYGDADGNGFVNAGDRGFVSANIGQSTFTLLCRFDMDGNGFVNAGDRGFVAANVGVCTPLPDWQNGSGLNHGVPDTRFPAPTFMGAGTTCETVTCP